MKAIGLFFVLLFSVGCTAQNMTTSRPVLDCYGERQQLSPNFNLASCLKMAEMLSVLQQELEQIFSALHIPVNVTTPVITPSYVSAAPLSGLPSAAILLGLSMAISGLLRAQ